MPIPVCSKTLAKTRKSVHRGGKLGCDDKWLSHGNCQKRIRTSKGMGKAEMGFHKTAVAREGISSSHRPKMGTLKL